MEKCSEKNNTCLDFVLLKNLGEIWMGKRKMNNGRKNNKDKRKKNKLIFCLCRGWPFGWFEMCIPGKRLWSKEWSRQDLGVIQKMFLQKFCGQVLLHRIKTVIESSLTQKLLPFSNKSDYRTWSRRFSVLCSKPTNALVLEFERFRLVNGLPFRALGIRLTGF